MAKSSSDDDERREVRERFGDAVNMTPKELEDWLATDESQSVGAGEGESVGHESGRRIVQILRAKQADLDDDDHQHMKKVAGYVARHLAQRPDGDVTQTRWRYSLMNWGHDPLK
ncbi:DUF3140 domain-containing protein [Kineococcus terrestris]|uniref:DUF3140 domain-containing protein n=1 Tax=Kineococcus terrestris TaxID=2044856 RepID=UPI0034DB149B